MAEGRFDDAVKLRGKWGMHAFVLLTESQCNSAVLRF